MKFKRKVVALCLTFAMVMSLLLTNASAKNGDVIGYTRYTDIVAYINNYAIQSYNYKDYTYIVAEDLQNYGFHVVWDGTARTLNITRNSAVVKVIENNSLMATPTEQVGKYALSVLETDIRTYINGVEVESYNVDGKTIIQFDSLYRFGDVTWYEDLRIITLEVKDGLMSRETRKQFDPNVVAEYSGYGDRVISNVNVPEGEYVAVITFDSKSYHSVTFYYGEGKYDHELLVNDSGKAYRGTTYLKGGYTSAVINGMFEIETEGSWTIKIQKLTKQTVFPINGSGDMVTGLFEGTGNREVFNINFDSNGYHSVMIYKYNGGRYDHDLLVNDSGNVYNGQVMAPTEKGEKYFFVIEDDGNWSISR